VSDTLSTTWRRSGAFAGLMTPGRHGDTSGAPGIRSVPREPASVLSLIAARGAQDDAARLIGEKVGLAPPARPAAALEHGAALVWSGPGQWLLVSDEPVPAAGLAAALGPAVAVVDQGHSRAILRLSGPKARAALARGCMLDLHPRAFRAGSAASTVIGHIATQIWQVDDAPAYDLSVYRSLAGSFWHWLAGASAEFGCEVAPPSS
jgi:sarcosine oxidase subunit gamma